MMTNYSIPDSRALGKFPFLRRLTTRTRIKRSPTAFDGLLNIVLLAILLWPQPVGAAPARALETAATVTKSAFAHYHQFPKGSFDLVAATSVARRVASYESTTPVDPLSALSLIHI